MTALFIDSTYDITLGILDDDLGWINFEKFTNQKASAIIQTETHKLMTKAGIKFPQVKSVYSVAGPGFYTGLRLSEGFADVLSFSGISHFSFLSYDIPKMTGITGGVWMTKAYRGEYFFHFWDGNEGRNELVSAKELEKFIGTVDKSNFYIHSESAIDDFSRDLVSDRKCTHDLLKTHSKSIFSQVNSKLDSFYFRAPEDEFKVSG